MKPATLALCLIALVPTGAPAQDNPLLGTWEIVEAQPAPWSDEAQHAALVAAGKRMIKQVITFAPRRDGRPETREGRLARNFKGEVRVDEHLSEVVRIDATAIDDISYGMGVVARLNEGAQVRVERQQIEPNLWLPISIRFQGQGRALLFRKLNVDYGIDWWDYRRVAARDEAVLAR